MQLSYSGSHYTLHCPFIYNKKYKKYLKVLRGRQNNRVNENYDINLNINHRRSSTESWGEHKEDSPVTPPALCN